MSEKSLPLADIHLETVKLIADGKTKMEIALILDCQYETIVKRVRVCRERTDTINNAALVAYCIRNKLIK